MPEPKHQFTTCVLICTYNRHELLRGALESLARCDPPADHIVVVNGGDARADEVVQGYANCGLPVELIRTKNINLAVSRNVGLKHCQADIVAMTDDDAEVFQDWIGQIIRAHRDRPDAGAVGGPVIGAGGGNRLVSKVADLTTFPRYTDARLVRSLPGVNIAYKREAIEAAGEYDADMFRGEDVDFNWRVLKAGYLIVYDPAVRVYHHHRTSARSLLEQHYMYGRAYYRVRRKWPEMHSVYPRKLSSAYDLRKLIWFALSPLLLPMAQSVRLGIAGLPAAPLLYAREVSWRLGLIRQMLLDRHR